MTLRKFLTLTAALPASELRRATAVALSVEKPTSREAYARFYRRVVSELGVADGADDADDADGLDGPDDADDVSGDWPGGRSDPTLTVPSSSRTSPPDGLW